MRKIIAFTVLCLILTRVAALAEINEEVKAIDFVSSNKTKPVNFEDPDERIVESDNISNSLRPEELDLIIDNAVKIAEQAEERIKDIIRKMKNLKNSVNVSQLEDEIGQVNPNIDYSQLVYDMHTLAYDIKMKSYYSSHVPANDTKVKREIGASIDELSVGPREDEETARIEGDNPDDSQEEDDYSDMMNDGNSWLRSIALTVMRPLMSVFMFALRLVLSFYNYN